MTAGRGITHSERFERARAQGGRMNGIQAWVALPQECEEIDPAFAHHDAHDLPVFEENGVWTRLIAGSAFGAKSPVRTHSPMFYLHCEVAAAMRASVPDGYAERALYVAAGSVEIAGSALREGQMAVLEAEGPIPFTALEHATVMLLGGESVGERFIEWNFVSSSKERIEQAKADWRAGRMKLPDLDSTEFIPLPGEPAAPPNPMS
jgi:redox-sensitive bicupin YhaK (pirin superfamily)